MGTSSRKPKSFLLCQANGRISKVHRRSDIDSKDLLLVKSNDEGLVILILNILLKTHTIKNISSSKSKSILAYVINGNKEEIGGEKEWGNTLESHVGVN